MFNTLFLIALGFILLRFAVKVATKVLGILLLVLGVVVFTYYKGIGPFKKNYLSIEELDMKYCGPDGDQITCSCIIEPLKEDMRSRFSDTEQTELQANRLKGAYVLGKSLNAQDEQIRKCLQQRSAENKLREFKLHLYTFDNPAAEVVGRLFNAIMKSADTAWDEMKGDKEAVDTRY